MGGFRGLGFAGLRFFEFGGLRGLGFLRFWGLGGFKVLGFGVVAFSVCGCFLKALGFQD